MLNLWHWATSNYVFHEGSSEPQPESLSCYSISEPIDLICICTLNSESESKVRYFIMIQRLWVSIQHHDKVNHFLNKGLPNVRGYQATFLFAHYPWRSYIQRLQFRHLGKRHGIHCGQNHWIPVWKVIPKHTWIHIRIWNLVNILWWCLFGSVHGS